MVSNGMQRGLLIGMIGLCLIGCERRSAAPTEATAPDEAAPQHVSWDAYFVMNEGERQRAALAADRMEQYSRGDSTFALLRSDPDSTGPQRATAWLFDAEGDSSATLTADSLIYYDQERRFEAFGGVVVVTQEDKRLESEFLTWEEDERKIRTNRFVHITTPAERVAGYGLVADEDLDTYQIGRFTAQVTIEDDAPPPDSTAPPDSTR